VVRTPSSELEEIITKIKRLNEADEDDPEALEKELDLEVNIDEESKNKKKKEDSDDKEDTEDTSEDSPSKDAEDKDLTVDSSKLTDTIKELVRDGHKVNITVTAEGKMAYTVETKDSLEAFDDLADKDSKSKEGVGEKSNKKGSSKDKKEEDLDDDNDKKGDSDLDQLIYDAVNKLTDKVASMDKRIKELDASSSRKKELAESYGITLPVGKNDQVKANEFLTVMDEIIDRVEGLDWQLDFDDDSALSEGTTAPLLAYDSMQQVDPEITGLINECDEALEALTTHMNNLQEAVAFSNGKTSSIDSCTDTFSDTVNPLVENITQIKGSAIGVIDTHAVGDVVGELQEAVASLEITNTLEDAEELQEAAASLEVINSLEDTEELQESLLALDKLALLESVSDKLGTKASAQVLDELRSDILSVDASYDVLDHVAGAGSPWEAQQSLADAITNLASIKSDIINVPDLNTTDYPTGIATEKVPFKSDVEASTRVTIKSAISNLTEALTDLEGAINFDLADKVFLYRKTNTPKSLADYAFPIAQIDETGSCYAVPQLVQNASKILTNKNCMRTYNIPDQRVLDEIRSRLMPYLDELNIAAPWA
jgi:hypothetical protein